MQDLSNRIGMGEAATTLQIFCGTIRMSYFNRDILKWHKKEHITAEFLLCRKRPGAPSAVWLGTRVGNPPAVHKNVYDLSKNAYVLIFHHDTFKESRYNREGSAEDMKKIKQTLQKYRCDRLDINENLTCSSVLKKMDKISTQNFSNNSCLIVFILSHGNVNDTIMAQDGYMYSFHSDIVEQCTSNKTLKNKPKIFVLQACRGDATIVTDATRSLSNKIDIVAFQSSYLGTVSYRDKRKGSFFMQAFLRLLDEHNQQSIININTLLNREFNEEGILQTPTLMTTLQKELIFGKLLRKR
uniref:Caspase family p20 domain-containing protein n=1 Tax=Anopheles culicifacies TaxID=139723 RepID=A0A182M5Q9_9DIPT